MISSSKILLLAAIGCFITAACGYHTQSFSYIAWVFVIGWILA